jgi:hypothetical protein
MMTARAGWAGILGGLFTTLVVYLLFILWPGMYLQGWSAYAWLAAGVAGILALGSGRLGARWSGSAHPGRCTVLGALAGGLAGTVVFCLWGAALAGLVCWVSGLDPTTSEAVYQSEIIGAIVRQTMGMFLTLFVGGSGLGAIGGWWARPRPRREDVFDRVEPQMALNATITALPASIIAAALAAAVFSRLAEAVGGPAGEMDGARMIADLPLLVSLLLVLVSHFALMLVIPHEARQVEHLCGMDEVKMAAYVGIGAAPLLIVLLLLIDADCFTNLLVITALLASSSMSLKVLHTLRTLILPRRASFPARPEGWQKTEAIWFGTIATSRGSRLVVLCIGCGLVMVLPLYVVVISVLINLSAVQAGSLSTPAISEVAWQLFTTQALVSSGVVMASVVALTSVYLFYLGLGRWFNQWNSRRLN